MGSGVFFALSVGIYIPKQDSHGQDFQVCCEPKTMINQNLCICAYMYRSSKILSYMGRLGGLAS